MLDAPFMRRIEGTICAFCRKCCNNACLHSTERSDYDQNSTGKSLADLHQTILAIASLFPYIERTIGNNLFGFASCYVVLGNVGDVRLIPIKWHCSAP